MKKGIRKLLGVWCALCLGWVSLTPPAAAQEDLSLINEQLLFMEIPAVTSVSFFATEADKAPGNTVVISQTKIVDSPARTMGDLVEYYVPGMMMGRHEYGGGLVAARGIMVDNNAKTLLLLGGQNINQRGHLGSELEWKVPLMGDVASIEVINGPNAIVHGSGAISGLVNMIPKNGTDYQGWSASTEYGFVDQLKKAELGYGYSYGEGRDVYAYLGWVTASGINAHADTWPDSFNALRGRSTGEAGDIDDGEKVQGFPQDNFKFTLNWNHDQFKLLALFEDYHATFDGPDDDHATREAELLAASPWLTGLATDDIDNSNEPTLNVTKLSIGPEYTIELTDTLSLDLKGSIQYMQHSYDNTIYMEDWSTGSGYAYFLDGEKEGGRENHFGIKTILKSTAINRHSIALGTEFGRREFKQNDTWFHGKVDAERGEYVNMHWRETSLFGEDVIELTDRWQFSAGVRHDEFNYSDVSLYYTQKGLGVSEKSVKDLQNTSYRLATSYEVDDTATVKLMYSEGFRAPDAGYWARHALFDVLANSKATPFDLPDLKPEEMTTTELNFIKEFPKEHLRTTVNVYENAYKQTLFWHDYASNPYPFTAAEVAQVTGTNPYWMGAPDNGLGEFKSRGFELVGDWDVNDDFSLHAIYGYSRPVDVDEIVWQQMKAFLVTNDMNDWLMYPEHTFKLWCKKEFLDDKLMASLAWVYGSGREISGASPYLGSGNGKIYGSNYSQIDVACRYNIKEDLSVKLVIQNLLENKVPQMTNNFSPYEGASGQENRYWYLSLNYQF